jgi:hypothetical protein
MCFGANIETAMQNRLGKGMKFFRRSIFVNQSEFC